MLFYFFKIKFYFNYLSSENQVYVEILLFFYSNILFVYQHVLNLPIR